MLRSGVVLASGAVTCEASMRSHVSGEILEALTLPEVIGYRAKPLKWGKLGGVARLHTPRRIDYRAQLRNTTRV